MERAIDLIRATAEIAMLLALALLGLVLLPLFCVKQALAGDPLWFWPRYAKYEPSLRRGGRWDHP